MADAMNPRALEALVSSLGSQQSGGLPGLGRMIQGPNGPIPVGGMAALMALVNGNQNNGPVQGPQPQPVQPIPPTVGGSVPLPGQVTPPPQVRSPMPTPAPPRQPRVSAPQAPQPQQAQVETPYRGVDPAAQMQAWYQRTQETPFNDMQMPQSPGVAAPDAGTAPATSTPSGGGFLENLLGGLTGKGEGLGGALGSVLPMLAIGLMASKMGGGGGGQGGQKDWLTGMYFGGDRNYVPPMQAMIGGWMQSRQKQAAERAALEQTMLKAQIDARQEALKAQYTMVRELVKDHPELANHPVVLGFMRTGDATLLLQLPDIAPTASTITNSMLNDAVWKLKNAPDTLTENDAVLLAHNNIYPEQMTEKDKLDLAFKEKQLQFQNLRETVRQNGAFARAQMTFQNQRNQEQFRHENRVLEIKLKAELDTLKEKNKGVLPKKISLWNPKGEMFIAETRHLANMGNNVVDIAMPVDMSNPYNYATITFKRSTELPNDDPFTNAVYEQTRADAIKKGLPEPPKPTGKTKESDYTVNLFMGDATTKSKQDVVSQLVSQGMGQEQAIFAYDTMFGNPELAKQNILGTYNGTRQQSADAAAFNITSDDVRLAPASSDVTATQTDVSDDVYSDEGEDDDDDDVFNYFGYNYDDYR